MTDPTFWQRQIAEALTLSAADLRRHASVSRDNRHRCRECFTCACLTVLEGHLGERRADCFAASRPGHFAKD
jgi:hypothetical protein